MNPVFLLDEVDKMSMDFRGDPSAALLEVLDPEQNSTFLDHYLDVEYDLSNVMFICTANVLHTIPQALRDRMEVLQLAGYTELEKIEIAKKFLTPKAIEGTGLTKDNISFTDESIQRVINGYTREAGVRNLERELASVIRGVAMKVADEPADSPKPAIVVDKADVAEYLGPPKFFRDLAEHVQMPGVATGLSVTSVGGDILFIEASAMPGKGKLSLTGKLGDVMKESAQAAMSWVRSHTEELGITSGFFDNIDIHLHVPQGGIPKDGPSAGIALVSAVVSMLTGRKVRSDLAMTGEVTLRGAVLPVGGIKSKVLAAHRAGIKTVILPERNRKDLVEVPDEIRKELRFVFVSRIPAVLEEALEATPMTGVATHTQKPAATATNVPPEVLDEESLPGNVPASSLPS
jgi:ATP-dependent Lon protease